jgi:hypothetical protein
MKRFPVRTFVTVGIAALLLGLSTSPALAAPPTPRALVTGSSMYAVGCGTPANLQLFSVDGSTAAGTEIGSGSNINSSTCATQGAWDAVTHTAYYPATDGTVATLVSVDLTTGVSTEIGGFTVAGAPTMVDSMAIGTDGAAYALSSGTLYSVDLATADLTPIAAVSYPWILGFAVDPTSGEFFTINDVGLISSIDVATGVLTTVGQTSFNGPPSTFSLQIDSNGIMWVENDDQDANSNWIAELWSVDPANVAGSAIYSGTLSVTDAQGTTQPYTNSFLIVPAVAPAITSAPPAASIETGSAVSFTVAASGSAPVAFSISAGALPTGLTLDSATGVVSGTPTTAGSFTYTVTASNGAGTTTASYTQLVTLAASPTPTPSTTPTPSSTSTTSSTSDIHLPIVSG